MQTKQYYKPCWLEILSRIELADSMLELSISLKITYSHLAKICTDLQQKGYLTTQKIGRSRVFKLTNKGKKVLNTPLGDLNNPIL